MLSPIKSRRLVLVAAMALATTSLGALLMPTPAQAQSLLGTSGGNQVVCTGNGGSIVIRDNSCDAGGSGLQFPTGFQVGNATFNATTNATTFIGGTVQVNAPITITGPTALNATTTFAGSSTFNALADFNNGITSNTITNSGTISTSTLSAGTIVGTSITASGNLFVSAGSNVDMGNNVVHFVAAGVADTDAVNVAQLNAATAGITADVTALETTTATHTTQISDLQTTTATHTTQITAIEAVNTTQSTQITAIEAVNTTQSTQITAIEAVNTTQSTQITAIEAVNTTQSSQITAIQAVNTTQSSQISALEAATASLGSDIGTLFDLRSSDRQDMKQGVASAMAMAAAPMPSEPGRFGYAVNGATFRGEYAVGGSLTYRLPSDTPVAVNVGFSYAGNKNNGVRVGVAGEF